MPTRLSAPIVKPLKVDYQNGQATLWAIVDTEMKPKDIFVFCIGTGHPFPSVIPHDAYLNTTVSQSDPYVWHWFCDVDLFQSID